ncbi:MAG TPA: tetratricopeptide repeat protein [Amycolatopsis sp.]|uniref:tetratricopeptide repeat protein n=1 Tax=Amycolatopsis sp. TaxID=37632 RepID=UPI002B469E7A|nr:tetratricopeptide repeat protein [Amycolatopsis sp.]HKS49623.1 tetratricopeptide repeat protein [Amycolatopsis sp.]
MPAHRWIRASRRAERVAGRSALAVPPTLAVVPAHRRLRGPYTAVGTLLRAIVPDALDRCPDLVARHNVEILATTPELRGVVPATRETLTSLAVPSERTRFHSRLRTLRITHGLIDFLTGYLRVLGGGHALIVDDAHEADPTDREFLAVGVRRLDPALLTVVVTTGTGPLTEPPGPVAVPLHAELEAHCVPVDAVSAGPGLTALDLAREYVCGDGTSDDPAVVAAYERLATKDRARLHDERAAELETLAEPSLRLGAVPYHRERGSDRAGTGVRALLDALNTCLDLGFYHAVVDFGRRGRALAGQRTDEERWWTFTTKTTTALAALGRPEEALSLYDEARRLSTSPGVHMQAAYATAMIYTRHLDEDRRDHEAARAWSNQSIAIANLLPDRKQRAFHSAFNRNGLALIEVHEGNPAEALRLLDDGLERLDEDLDAGEYALHRSVLRVNRAQVHASLGRLDHALADYTAVIAMDPNYAEYYFDRAALLRRLGRNEDALADYDDAIRLSPPFPEAYYNRGDLRLELGDIDGALADFGYTLDLDPDFVDAYVNRAGLHLDLGDLADAARDAEAGLARDQDNPHLHVVIGQIHVEHEEYPAASAAFDRALAVDPDLIPALSGRAALACRLGEADLALTDLRHAVDLAPGDPLLRYNRAFAYQHKGQWDQALADLKIARELSPGDPEIAEAHETCLRHTTAATLGS